LLFKLLFKLIFNTRTPDCASAPSAFGQSAFGVIELAGLGQAARGVPIGRVRLSTTDLLAGAERRQEIAPSPHSDRLMNI
jgi:hypothetical protein